MAYVVIACIDVAYKDMAYIATVCIVMAYIGTTYVGMVLYGYSSYYIVTVYVSIWPI